MRRKVRFIGDAHGKFDRYKKIIQDAERSVQIGDMGIGFLRRDCNGDLKRTANPPHALMVKHSARFLRGNHDAPEACKRHSQWIADGTVENDMMFIGGATSIDRVYRVENESWWRDEECSMSQLNHFVEVYATVRPRIMVTHEVPESIADGILAATNRSKIELGSRTRQALEGMLSIHAPEIWIAGHWHVDIDQVVNGTRFIVLNELSYVDLEI
jgi:hypothetical protein